MVANVTRIARAIQLCNERVVRLHNRDTSNVSIVDDDTTHPGAVAAANPRTGCIVCINVNYQRLLRELDSPSRRRLKPCVAAPQFKAARVKRYFKTSFLNRAELAINKMLQTNCSSCNDLTLSTSQHTTTVGGDQPLNKKSARYIYLNESTCVLQEGVFYGHYFVPERKGKELGWFSSPAAKPKQISARVCCLLNAINTFTGDGNGAIKQFEVLTKPPSGDFLGPLGQKCVKQAELEEPGPVLVFIRL